MSYFKERKQMMAIAEFQREMNEVLFELDRLQQNSMIEGLEAYTPEKERNLIEKVIKAFLKTEGATKELANEVSKTADLLSKKLKATKGIATDIKAFSEAVIQEVPYADVFVKRPAMYDMMDKKFTSLTQLLKDPVHNDDDPYGPTLTGIIRMIEDCGFKFDGTSISASTAVLLPTIFKATERGALQTGKTAKELGYTPDNILKVAEGLLNGKSGGYFKTVWLNLRSGFFVYRLLWDLLAGRSTDESNRFKGIRIRIIRLNVVTAMNFYLHWHQRKKDMVSCDKLLRAITRHSRMGSEGLLNLAEVDPETILVDQEVTESEDVVVDATDTVVQPGYEDELDNEEAEVMKLVAEFEAKLACDFPTHQIRDAAKKSINQTQLNNNRVLAKKIINLYNATEKKNERMLNTLDKMLIHLERYRRKCPTVFSAEKMAEVTVPNIPSFRTMNAHLMAYDKLLETMRNSVNHIAAPVTYLGDPGPAIESMLNLCEFIDITAPDDKGMEGYSSAPIFDITQYDKETVNLKEAGYTIQDLHQMCRRLETIRKTLKSAGSVYSGYESISDSDLLELMSQIDYTDTVCALEAGKTRRMRYSMLTHLRSQIMLDSVVQDTAIMVRIMKRLSGN